MQPIKEVAILGAGAMGAFFAGKFFDNGFATRLIARGNRLEKLQSEGVIINEKPYTIPAISPESAAAPVDLIIVAVKNHHLPEAVKGLDNLVGDSTTIISVMNGLESEEYLGAIFGREKVLYAVSVGIDALREENRITYTKPGKHYFGKADNTRPDQKVMRVQQAFAKAAIPYEIPRDMMRIMWWKFMINVGMNQASTVMGAPYGVFQTSRDARQLMEALMQEVIAVAKAGAIELTQNDLEAWNSVLQGLSPQGKTSMLQDMEAGRKTEVEVFGKKMVELGRQHGLPTPVNRTLLQIIRVLEQNRRQA